MAARLGSITHDARRPSARDPAPVTSDWDPSIFILHEPQVAFDVRAAGAAGYAGEFGYIAIDSEGTRLEEVASTSNIVRRTRSRFNRDSTSSLGKLPEERIGIREIIKAVDDGDEFARLMLERTGTYVGTAIANVINLLNIETIVVGGEITEAEHVVIDAINARARELSFSRSFEKTRIVSGTVGENAAAIGSALLARV